MAKWKALLLAIGACVVTLVALEAQQNRSKGPTLTAQDHAEIQQLYARYCYGFDSHADNGWAWARTFAPDGVFVRGAGNIQGHEKLAAFAKAPPEGAPMTPRHYMTNIIVEPTAEGANGTAYAMLIDAGGSGKPAKVDRAFVYRDLLVKTSEGWRFKRREIQGTVPG